MKIISKRSDYYDYVGNINIADDKILYNRNVELKSELKIKGIIKRPSIEFNKTYLELKKYEYRFKYLVVFDTMYVCVSVNNANQLYSEEYKLLSEKESSHKELIDYIKKFDKWMWMKDTLFYDLKDYFGIKNNALIKACKELNQPIFMIDEIILDNLYSKNNAQSILKIDKFVPVLKDLGFSAIIKPEILYQEIEYFIANVLRDNPDIMPPVKISDKNKIEQYGFDLKQSFRHRK